MRPRRVFASVLLWSFAAHAEPHAACVISSDCDLGDYCIEGECRSVPLATEETKRESYGGQIVAADLVAVLTLGMGSVLSGPIVHLAHKRWATAAASFGLRTFGIALSGASGVLFSLALPPAAYNALGCAMCPPSPDYLPQMFVGLLIGAGVGWIVASVIDAVFLAHTR
jgi:hypothetical protein